MRLPLGKTESEFIDKEIDSLIKKGVTVKINHETVKFISPIFVRNKSCGCFRLVLNLKKLNKHVKYQCLKWRLFLQYYVSSDLMIIWQKLTLNRRIKAYQF